MMTDQQTIERARVSENPENFQAIFDQALATAKDVREKAMEANEATAAARNLGVGQKILETDLKGRVIDARLRARTVNPQIAERNAG